VVLVVGGSQGALGINELVSGWLDQGGGAGVTLLWATGRATAERFRRHHAPPEVQVFEFLDPIADAYAIADLAVARAGMMTIAELCAWGIPSVLIPLPTSANDHQTRNAAAVAAAGAAVHRPQRDLDPGGLGRLVAELLADRARLGAMGNAARARGRPDATRLIVDRLEALAGG
jgi:UDP-N-acetylglucosamine--N-acetylmuramyl-(pentapeptide) pyrophosphoryl-undecaprenol N-acetylglucosamine transferase